MQVDYAAEASVEQASDRLILQLNTQDPQFVSFQPLLPKSRLREPRNVMPDLMD